MSKTTNLPDPPQGGVDERITPEPKGLVVRTAKLTELHPDPSNARLHDERNLDAIGASLATFGQVEPLVVQKSTGRIIGSNGRYEVLKRQGKTEAAIVEVDLDDTQAVALGIALNRTAELAEWDDETLASLLQSLPQEAKDATGFDSGDLDELLAGLTPDVVEDEAPEPLPDAVSKLGDLWELGDHRLLCGDSTDGGSVALVMNGEHAGMVLTDPPYGVDYVGKTEHALEVKNDDAAGLPALLRSSLGHAYANCQDGAVWYVAAPAGPQGIEFAVVLRDLNVWRQTLVWVKDSMVLGHSDFHYKHEAIYYGWKAGKRREPPTRTCTTVLEFARPKSSREHPTMKPIELWCFLLGCSSGLSTLVYEPFSRSGTTIIACEQLGRKCYAIEIEPRYVDVAIRRWQKLTGNAATLDGKTWAEVAADRGVKID